MEELTRLRPRNCSFDLDVPSRNALWYLNSGYEPLSTAIFRSACTVADVIIDIGAHIGYYSCLASSVCPQARVIAVEASPENGLVVSSNAALNKFSIELHNAAFSNATGRVNFEVTEASDNCGLSGHPNSPTVNRIDVGAITGNELAITPNQKLVIKINVEGHELSALQGLEKVLTEANDVRLLLEFNVKCILLADQSPTAVLEWIWEHGFRVFALDEQKYWWSEVTDVSFVDQVGLNYVNLWCVPSTSALTVSAVMHSANLGGVERSHVEVVQNLVAAGCMVHTILPSPDMGLVNLLHDAGSSTSMVTSHPWWVVPRDYSDKKTAKNSWQMNLVAEDLVEEIKLVDPDVVLTQSIVSPQGALAALALGKPHVWWIREFADLDHNLQLPLTPSETGQLIASLSNKVLTNSAVVRDYFFPSEPENVCVVYPIPRLVFENTIKLRVDRPWTMGIVASFNPGKGHADVFAALASLIKDGLDIRLVCIGTGSDQDKDRLHQLAFDLGIAEKVTFSGQILDRSTIYEFIDAVVIASKSEAFGRVAFEATDAGVPVIYPLSGGIVEYMVADETGLAYTANDVVDLARAIKHLSNNRKIGQELVRAAQNRFNQFRNDPTRVSLLVNQLRASRIGASVKAENSLSFWLTKSILQNKISLVEQNRVAAETIAARDAAVLERNLEVVEAISLRDASVAERNSAVQERNAAVEERNAAIAASNFDRDAAVAERNSAVAAANAAVAERNSAVAAANTDRDAAVAERNALINSTIWKLFKPYRAILRFIKRI